MSDTMEELTGHGTDTYDVSDLSPDDLRKKLAQGDMITIGTNPDKDSGWDGWLRQNMMGENTNDELYKNKTLVPDHAYMVKDITADGQVVLVNPWDTSKTITIPYDRLAQACSYGTLDINTVT